MNKLSFMLVAAFAITTIAEGGTPTADSEAAAWQTSHEKLMRKMGGRIEKPGSEKGRFLVLDAQKLASADTVRATIERLAEIARYRIDYETVEASKVRGGDWVKVRKDADATAIVVLVDDDTTPSLLVSPDECWGVVNVRRIASTVGEKSPKGLLSARAVKQMLRAIALIGGSASRFKEPVGGAYAVADLDHRPDMLPMDQLQQLTDYLYYHGMRAKTVVSYRKACQEGWAPAPTNELQKAVWDEIHTLPSEPIKIKYDPKRDK